MMNCCKITPNLITGDMIESITIPLKDMNYGDILKLLHPTTKHPVLLRVCELNIQYYSGYVN